VKPGGWWIGTNVVEDPAVSILKQEHGRRSLLRNAGIRLPTTRRHIPEYRNTVTHSLMNLRSQRSEKDHLGGPDVDRGYYEKLCISTVGKVWSELTWFSTEARDGLL